MSNETIIVKKNPWLQPGFLLVVVLLSLCAVGLNSAVAVLKLHFTKQAVPLAKDLTLIPEQLGDWLQVSRDEPLDKGTQDLLGTQNYIFRDYVNVKTLTWADLVQMNVQRVDTKGHQLSVPEMVKTMFANKGSGERKSMVANLQHIRPDAVLNLAVTYYTGAVDTVAHIPERCYIADGYQPTESPETAKWYMGPGRLGGMGDAPIAVRYLNLQDLTAQGRVTKRVAYFFFTNGEYESDTVSVRQTLGNLRAKHGFYSKVELMSIIPDHDKSAQIMSGFLASAMPEIEKCYPDWNSVEHPGGK